MIIALLFFVLLSRTKAGYGDELLGRPNWQERASLDMTNAVRVGNNESKKKKIDVTV
jgi:hypothetical protein